jgi:hypothetical protein
MPDPTTLTSIRGDGILRDSDSESLRRSRSPALPYSLQISIASLTPREPFLPRSLGARICRIAQSVGAYRGNSCCSIFHLGGPDNYMLDARTFDSQPFDLPPHPPISAVAGILG